jgi:menaquinone-dependent protoporphyrinogen oxidase
MKSHNIGAKNVKGCADLGETKLMNNNDNGTNILVAYASRNGSTAGVAEAIGKTLSESGARVDVLPMQAVEDLAPYRAVVAGSAIQAAQWLPEAMQFVRVHRAELSRKPFAAFLVCMTLAMKAELKVPNGDYRQQVAAWLDPVRDLVPLVSTGLFAGALDTRKIKSLGDRLMFRLSVLMGVWSEGDHRDWNAIHAWAESLRPLLLP